MVPGWMASMRSMTAFPFLMLGSWKLFSEEAFPLCDNCTRHSHPFPVSTATRGGRSVDLVVDPGDDVAVGGEAVARLRALGEDGEGVGTHQLPHQRQRQRPVPIVQVLSNQPTPAPSPSRPAGR